MNKYRIVELTHKNGEKSYQIQQKFLLFFWIDNGYAFIYKESAIKELKALIEIGSYIEARKIISKKEINIK